MSATLGAHVQRAAADCARALLGAVGMSVNTRVDVHHSVVPETALVIAAIGGAIDPRLRDEARDWMRAFEDLIPRAALNELVHQLPESGRARWADFTSRTAPTSHKTRRVLDQTLPYGLLRTRAVFGAQARADALFHLALEPLGTRGWTSSALARTTNFKKDSVRKALDPLVDAGTVVRTRVGNTDFYAASDTPSIHALVGPIGGTPVDSNLVPRCLLAMHAASVVLDTDSSDLAVVGARAELMAEQSSLDQLRMHLPQPSTDLARQRAELIERISEACDHFSDPSRPLWPW